MGSSQSSRRVNDEAIAGDVARFLFLTSTMNGRVESFMIVRRGERWTSPAISGERARCMITVGLCLRSARRGVIDFGLTLLLMRAQVLRALGCAEPSCC